MQSVGSRPPYCRAIAMRIASSGETRWSEFSAASAMASWTPSYCRDGARSLRRRAAARAPISVSAVWVWRRSRAFAAMAP
jgi:hypothetical protein